MCNGQTVPVMKWFPWSCVICQICFTNNKIIIDLHVDTSFILVRSYLIIHTCGRAYAFSISLTIWWDMFFVLCFFPGTFVFSAITLEMVVKDPPTSCSSQSVRFTVRNISFRCFTFLWLVIFVWYNLSSDILVLLGKQKSLLIFFSEPFEWSYTE